MTNPPAVAPAVRRSRAQRGGALTGSIVLAVLCSLLAMSAGGNYGGRHSTFPVGIQIYAYLGLWIMIGVSIMLVWRHRWPVLVSIMAIGGALVIPSTPVPALIACAAVCAARGGRLRWVLVAGTFVVTVVALCWDLASSTSLLAIFVGEPAQGTPARLSLYWAVPVLAAAAVAPFAGFGILRGISQERDAAQLGTAAATRNVAMLRQEVERERERQDLARELHDTLAARLSSLSLHAGALELTAEGKDPATLAAARIVRETAQSSLDELRNVVHVLRNPAAAVPNSGLADIPALIDEAVEEGMDVHVRFLLSDTTSCDPQVAHACYRLVQESLSNIRRHAPGVAARLDVRGGPDSGVTITVANWLSSDPRPSTTGGGHGLQGMSERVALAGGTFRAGPTPDGTFAVAAWLPWIPNRG